MPARCWHCSGTSIPSFLTSCGDPFPDYSDALATTTNMDIKLTDYQVRRSPASSPKAGVASSPKPAQLRGFSASSLGLRWPTHWPGQPGAKLREPGAILAGKALEIGPFPPLGIPLNIREVARMIGCSPWTVRQTLIPRGLPVFRSGASGKLIFYRDQVVRWIEQIQGGQTTK